MQVLPILSCVLLLVCAQVHKFSRGAVHSLSHKHVLLVGQRQWIRLWPWENLLNLSKTLTTELLHIPLWYTASSLLMVLWHKKDMNREWERIKEIIMRIGILMAVFLPLLSTSRMSFHLWFVVPKADVERSYTFINKRCEKEMRGRHWKKHHKSGFMINTVCSFLVA